MSQEKAAKTHSGLNRHLGQFFSPELLTKKCISLISNTGGRILEPSCGNGAFKKLLGKKSVFIEIDSRVITDKRVKNIDFFDYPENEKFDTIIGNPPYVDNKFLNIQHKSNIKVQANLYLYFIEKCFHHLKPNGEIIFIVPRDFIKITSARYTNNLLYKNGSITDFYDYGDKKLFTEASPNVCIFRYEKGNFNRKTITNNGICNFLINDGIISFSKNKNTVTLGSLFDIKVGAVSGADKLFQHPSGDDFVYSKTRKTKNLKPMVYNEYSQFLDAYKDVLINRKIKHFTEQNWWSWGRPVNFEPDRPRIYVNCKTRISSPFFLNECKKWDGSILALFPKNNINIQDAVKILNDLDWDTMGFMTGGRYIFSQKSLKEALVDAKLFR